MAYFNADNANLHSTWATLADFDAHPLLGQASTAEEANLGTFADGWNIDGETGHVVGAPRSLGAETGFGLVTSATSQGAQTYSHGEPSFPSYYWPIPGQYAQSHYPGTVSQGSSLVNTVAAEASTVIPAPSSMPLDYWGDNESGPSTRTFYTGVQTSHQPNTGSTRTGLMQTWRFRPYVAPRAEHGNAEAGPSTLVSPPAPYVAPLFTYPSGGHTEATADADQYQTITEEDKAPATRQPRGTGKVRAWRLRYQQDVERLRVWAKGWEGLKKLPAHERALGIALDYVETIREPVYDAPRLARGAGTRTTEGKDAPDAEDRRRREIRTLNEELSRYYRLATNQRAWGCPGLLSKVLSDVENI